MENKQVLKFLFPLILIGVITGLLTSCSSTKIAIEVLQPPVTGFSKPVERIAVLDRVAVKFANTKQYINGQVVGQFNGISDMMVNEAMNQLVLDVNKNDYVEILDTSLQYIIKNGSVKSQPIQTILISRACKDLDVDAIVCIEGYDAEIDTDSDVQYSTPVDRNYGTVRVPYFTGDQSVYMEMFFRSYLCETNEGKVENETKVATQVSASASGSSPYDVNVKLADANNILIQASRKLGEDYARQILPSWETQTRFMYISGSDQLKDAYKLAKVGNWPAATDIWYLLATTNNEKLAKRASFNLILASEISGELELADEWARRCEEKYKMEEASKYILILEQRKKEIDLIRKSYPLMAF